MEILTNKNKRWKKRLLISTPTLGLIRFEWAHARFSQVIPVNWESSGFDIWYSDGKVVGADPLGFSIDDAYNLIVNKVIELDVEWLLIIEDDVIIPANCFVKFTEHMEANDKPIVSGLYYLKSSPTIPLVFRGRGNGAYKDFEIGDKVWCDGVPMGCLLVHASIIKYMHEQAEEYRLSNGQKAKKVFETPRKVFIDPETAGIHTLMGTQDLYWCDRILDEGVLEKTGWDEIAKKQHPFLVDTTIFCKHIDINTGIAYP